jgi:hypothetical protein
VEEMCQRGMKEKMGKMVGKGGECSEGSEVLANGGVRWVGGGGGIGDCVE